MTKKLTPLAADLRSMSEGIAPSFSPAGSRRHFAAKANPTARRSKPVNESGVASLYSSDMITMLFQSLKVMPDPDEVLRKAGMTRGALRKLSYDDEIAQALETRRDAAINTPWRLEGGADDVNKFITEQIKAFEHLILPSVWNARPYGYSVTQVVYEQTVDGKIGIRWVGEMPFEFYFPQRDGTILYRPQGQGTPIPVLPQKYLVPIVNPTYQNPYGDALLSRLYWLWFFRTHGWQFWIQWLEQFGAPFLVGKTKNTKPSGSTSTSVELLAAALDKARRGSSIALDIDSEVEQLETSGTGQQFKSFDDAISRQVTKMILGQTLTSGTGEHGAGSRALGQVHDEVRKDKRRADVRVIKLSLQQLVGFLFELNAFAGEVPQFVMEDEKGIEKDRAERDASFVEKGVLVFKRPYLQDHYDLAPDDFIAPGEPGFLDAKGSPPQQQIDPATGKPKKPATTPPADAAKKQALLAQLFAKQGIRFTPEQEVIEGLVMQMADELPAELLANADVLTAIREASDPNDLANRLSVAMQDADVLTFNRVLNFGLGAATVIGFVHAAERTTPPTVKAAAEPSEMHFHVNDGSRLITGPDGKTWRSDPAPPPES